MKKVMLLEDDLTMLSLLETLLQIEGYSINKINKVENFIDEVKNFMPDLILMDIFLDNGFDGRDLIKEIVSEDALSNIKIIISSGSDHEKESLSLGANDFIFKPYMPQELMKKIENLVSK